MRKLWQPPAPDEPSDLCAGLMMFISGGASLPPMMRTNVRKLAVELGGEPFARFCEEHPGTALAYVFDSSFYPRDVRAEHDAAQRNGRLSPSFANASTKLRASLPPICDPQSLPLSPCQQPWNSSPMSPML